MKHHVERLFPFARRANITMVGRHNLLRIRKHLHFILITDDISDNSRKEILHDYADMPVLQCYVSSEIETHFGFHNCKVIGFRTSSLAHSIYRELKTHRINTPPEPEADVAPDEAPEADQP